ncbi:MULTISPECIES: TetR/AcrR family transcriptional regulator [Mycolicibacterium]|uniref:Transcriptional regulator, TetR family n=1 Tax=Mycolicibacterium vanbaalenii (strain DSM 7251 / JCM 13017 / BCRC 16820 / KCTC 9966 / NRRL B-24157 / PYR-1) TaxID=350058 RepID=A1T574_MYCVP|nr:MULTISPECIES: TetR/AcrR family transcriptional regulator [Mycolicibacterium]ABM12324.1 transcriptional regulator, TetR family [Mycolicibacterium vanbaalenii PYR-1]MCV7127705.1 TetR/AcrR family transcriptional regulator [Mycolicibacterium vanbaalenii PYR-1]QZT58247.1 TetR/AcrR family transcriptional regulator [Mycolicibacterium austroafricanum]QZY47578.1 TetR/AcrR family transcriptional regulator [Mycolicibacterium austroafricanum]UJL31307.1 TetR/AcrR family transcriptional regulator [Mycoli
MTPPDRPVRADAARNRALLLAAAEEEFAERGPSASVADIARRAGVAKGTVFRHFPTKEDLIAAIVSEHIAVLAAAARRLADSPDPGAALLEFLTIAADQRQRHDLTFLQSASDGDPRVTEVRDALHANLETLVDRARTSGAIRADITEADVFLMMCAPIHIVENLPAPAPLLWQRYLAIIFDGLRPDGAHPLPQPAPAAP